MSTTLMIVLAVVIYVAVYLLYGKRVARVAKLDAKNVTPAHRLFDGVDYVPGKWPVVFGHHFASIAGAGPIIGPIVGITWGWAPCILWIWFGNAFIGAVHDFMALLSSVRYDGRSVQWVAGEVMRPRVSIIFGIFVWIAMVLVISAFTNVVSGLFASIPPVATASILFIVIAVIVGYLLYWKKQSLVAMTILGLVLLVAAIIGSQSIPMVAEKMTWIWVLLVYIILAAALPVTILLQPRDYLNSYLLVAFLAVGGVAFLLINAPLTWPAFTSFSAYTIGGQPSPFWPTVPLIIACGSLSGFHAIVGSGTTSKMLDNELHTLSIGYGGMLTEGFLSTIVLVSLGAFGLKIASVKAAAVGVAGWVPLGIPQFSQAYAMGANQAFGMSVDFGVTFASLVVCAFALTSLDTTCRLGRFAWQDLLGRIVSSPSGQASGGFKFLTHRWVASAIAAGVGVYMATTGGVFSAIWAAFGAANQMLAAVALMAACVFSTNVLRGGQKCWITLIPAFFLWVTVFSAMIWYIVVMSATASPLTIGFMAILVVLAVILLIETIGALKRGPQK
ncbi:MAG: carbon starvation protein A [Chloroflexi bacterium]|nr:carbon starvation protein A [Chloroflexota bacterium]